MAAKALDPRIVSAIQADWRTGRYSQRDLAEKHKVSAGTAAKMTKGVPKDSVMSRAPVRRRPSGKLWTLCRLHFPGVVKVFSCCGAPPQLCSRSAPLTGCVFIPHPHV